MQELSGKEFQIGLTMSGAISAGAYTAGVVDFLIEALETWEAERAGPNGAKAPNHRVGIKVMSGASAGAITAAIGAIALADGESGASSVTRDGFTYRFTLPKLYESWVIRPTLVAESDSDNDFLKMQDIEECPPAELDLSFSSTVPPPRRDAPIPVVSLLNSRLLDEIALRAIAVTFTAAPRPYIATELHVYLTLSNLRGVPWSVPFDGGDYHMISHGDRVHYLMRGIGGWNSPSAFGTLDPHRRLDVTELINGDAAAKNKWKDYAVCALGSSAFPVGLAPRRIGAVLGTDLARNEYDGRRIPEDDIVGYSDLAPNWPDAVLTRAPFWFTCADGGVINNDPFEFARFSLKDGDKLNQRIPWSLDAVDRAVIMISPFPEEKPILGENEPALDIVSLFSSLMPALIDQARFKPSELALAVDPDHGTRFLIGPSREINGQQQRYGIASGLLGGFGGFVARSFRDHDYQLGRQNCQKFLLEQFVLPEGERNFAKSWAATVEKKQFEVQAPTTSTDKRLRYPIIPLFGEMRNPVSLPAWPQISQAEFDKLQERIAARFDRIAPLLVQQNVQGILGFLLGLILKPGFRNIPGLARDKALAYVRLAIMSDLVRRNQIKGWDLPPDLPFDPDDVRLVIAELLSPKYDERSLKGINRAVIAVARDLDESKVQAILERLQKADGKPYQVWEAPWKTKDADRVFTLVSRKPNIADGVLGGRLGVDFFKPSIDPPGL
jgi:hypothetical protein